MEVHAEESQVRAPLVVYTIVARERDGRKFWVRIGTAFRNRDGSVNSGAVIPALSLRCAVGVVTRQVKPDGGSAVDFTVHLCVAIRPAHDAIHHGQTEAGAVRLGRKKRVGDTVERFRTEARARVGHSDADVFARCNG